MIVFILIECEPSQSKKNAYIYHRKDVSESGLETTITLEFSSLEEFSEYMEELKFNKDASE